MISVKKLPTVGKIEGLALTPHEDPARARVTLQYTDPTGGWCETSMRLPDAVHLQNLLTAMCEEQGIRPPR